MTENDVVEVICFVFPNGDVFHAEKTVSLNAAEVVNTWKKRFPAHASDARLMGGFVGITMRREDYVRIPATSDSAALFGAS